MMRFGNGNKSCVKIYLAESYYDPYYFLLDMTTSTGPLQCSLRIRNIMRYNLELYFTPTRKESKLGRIFVAENDKMIPVILEVPDHHKDFGMTATENSTSIDVDIDLVPKKGEDPFRRVWRVHTELDEFNHGLYFFSTEMQYLDFILHTESYYTSNLWNYTQEAGPRPSTDEMKYRLHLMILELLTCEGKGARSSLDTAVEKFQNVIMSVQYYKVKYLVREKVDPIEDTSDFIKCENNKTLKQLVNDIKVIFKFFNDLNKSGVQSQSNQNLMLIRKSNSEELYLVGTVDNGEGQETRPVQDSVQEDVDPVVDTSDFSKCESIKIPEQKNNDVEGSQDVEHQSVDDGDDIREESEESDLVDDLINVFETNVLLGIACLVVLAYILKF